MTVSLRTVPFTDHDARELVEELNLDMQRRYGEGDATPVDPTQFDAPSGTFLVLHDEAGAAGCVGVRSLPGSAGTAEVKRMWVRADRRRRGYARTLLNAAEEFARTAGYERLVLETGDLQPESMALYESHGFSPIEPYGHYRDDPACRCYAVELLAARSR